MRHGFGITYLSNLSVFYFVLEVEFPREERKLHDLVRVLDMNFFFCFVLCVGARARAQGVGKFRSLGDIL